MAGDSFPSLRVRVEEPRVSKKWKNNFGENKNSYTSTKKLDGEIEE